jgi:O-antigen/teichoic acid export membrane protein
MRVLVAFVCNTLFNFAIGLLVAKFLGPTEYGRFALALATGMAVQAAFFDWLRLGATRFYSERIRSEDPALRSTLDLGFVFITFGLVIGACLLLFSGVTFALSNGLIVLALGAAMANGFFDYNTALVRARFNDRLYTRLVVVKNLLAFSLTGGGAFFFGSAKMTLIGGILSLSGSVITARAALKDPGAGPRLARRSIAATLMHYSLPIVGANVLYLLIPLANRSIVTILYGFAETGQFSLAYDLGTKAIQAIGSTLDVLLFQIAVATHELHGASKAKQQVAANMAIVIAIVLPACTGIWLILPSIQEILVPAAFRGPFGWYMTLMMTGFFCSALIQYAINPIFQIAKRTAPLIGAALIACIVDPLLIFLLPRSEDASSLAIAQAGAFLAALLALIVFASFTKPQWPRARDLAATVFGTAAMAAALLPLRDHDPGVTTLAEQVVAGVIIYACLCLGLDIAGLRGIVLTRMQPLLAGLGGGVQPVEAPIAKPQEPIAGE